MNQPAAGLGLMPFIPRPDAAIGGKLKRLLVYDLGGGDIRRNRRPTSIGRHFTTLAIEGRRCGLRRQRTGTTAIVDHVASPISETGHGRRSAARSAIAGSIAGPAPNGPNARSAKLPQTNGHLQPRRPRNERSACLVPNLKPLTREPAPFRTRLTGAAGCSSRPPHLGTD